MLLRLGPLIEVKNTLKETKNPAIHNFNKIYGSVVERSNGLKEKVMSQG